MYSICQYFLLPETVSASFHPPWHIPLTWVGGTAWKGSWSCRPLCHRRKNILCESLGGVKESHSLRREAALLSGGTAAGWTGRCWGGFRLLESFWVLCRHLNSQIWCSGQFYSPAVEPSCPRLTRTMPVWDVSSQEAFYCSSVKVDKFLAPWFCLNFRFLSLFMSSPQSLIPGPHIWNAVFVNWISLLLVRQKIWVILLHFVISSWFIS